MDMQDRLDQLAADGHARNVRLTTMEHAMTALARIEVKVDDGFRLMNGRVRSIEVCVAVLKWAVGIVGVAAGTLWAIGIERLFGR